jgi:hypothetical protein
MVGSCYLNDTCYNIDSGTYSDALNLYVTDIYGNGAPITISTYSTLIDGATFAMPGTCYIPIFQNQEGD